MRRTPITAAGHYRLVALALALWLAAGGLTEGAGAQPSPARLDLAALLLTPADAEAEGRPGMRLGEGRSFMAIGEAMAPQTYAYSRVQMNLSRLPGAEALLQDAGWQRFHELTLTVVDTSSGAAFSVFDVVSSIEEYATVEGATRAFDALSTQGALQATIDSTVVVDPGAGVLGEQSVGWSSTGVSDVSGDRVGAVARMVRVGNRIVSTALIDHTSPYDVDAQELDRLTSRLLDRVSEVGTTGQPCPLGGWTGLRVALEDRAQQRLPGISSCVLRLTRDETIPNRAAYTVRDGMAVQIWTETSEQLAARQANVDTIGVRDDYHLQYIIERDNRLAFYNVYITTYHDEAMATSRFDGLEERMRGDTGATVTSFDAGLPAVGDASATYATITNATGHAVTSSATRIGDMVITVRVSQTVTPVPMATQALLEAQVSCMQAGDCSQPVPVPAEVMPAFEGS